MQSCEETQLDGLNAGRGRVCRAAWATPGPTRVPALWWVAELWGPPPRPFRGHRHRLGCSALRRRLLTAFATERARCCGRGGPLAARGRGRPGPPATGTWVGGRIPAGQAATRTQGQPRGRRAFPGQRLFRARRGGSKVLPRSPTSAPDDGRGQEQRDGAAAVTGTPTLHWPGPVRSTPGTLGLPACPERPQNSAASGGVHTPQCAQTFRESVRVPHRPP